MASARKSVRKSAKKPCARGNKKGSVVVKGHTSKSGKRVLCFRRKKSAKRSARK